MNKRVIQIAAIVVFVLAASAAGYFVVNNSGKKSETLKYGSISKGNITVEVTSTGTIEPKKTVDVSTQVSGMITKINVDNNDKVKKGEILAVLDTQLLEISVKSAEADLLKAKSQYELALQEYNNNIALNKDKLVSDLELEKLRVTKDGDYADLLSAQSQLLTAKANLEYAVIKSPIDGIVIERSVEEGQTVAASSSAPTLFTLAEDLSNIEIEALVTESDIGSIKKGQKTTFTVEAYPDAQFEGEVTAVLLSATVDSNVVSYTVLISAKNKENMLLPGMTATINFIVSEKTDVLTVPNSALTFRPSEKLMKLLFGKMPKPPAQPNNGQRPEMGGTQQGGQPPADGQMPPPGLAMDGNSNSTEARIWVVGKDGKITMAHVTKGITDGQNTEVSGDTIAEGDKIIIGSTTSEKNGATTTTTTTTNNRQNNRGGMGGPPPMF